MRVRKVGTSGTNGVGFGMSGEEDVRAWVWAYRWQMLQVGLNAPLRRSNERLLSETSDLEGILLAVEHDDPV